MERCERCGRNVELRFVCLGRRLCFACASAVVRLTTRFPALHEIASSELAEVVDRDPSAADLEGRCSRCSSSGAPLRRAGRPLCLSCARDVVLTV
jgi:hypothetical protein